MISDIVLDCENILCEIKQHETVKLDLSYLSDVIYKWWQLCKDKHQFHFNKLKLFSIILHNIDHEHLSVFNNFSSRKTHMVGLFITGLFTKDDPKLALLIHETFSDICCLKDIKYPYESHKLICPTYSGKEYSEWGNGYGKISPHCDDLYEHISTDFLSLATCRDVTNTPTCIFFIKDLLLELSESELIQLLNLKAIFTSGKNVEGRILKSSHTIVSYDSQVGFVFNLDFRVDKDVGHRMFCNNDKDNVLIKKMREIVLTMKYKQFPTKTGNFLIVDNHKVMHGREKLNLSDIRGSFSKKHIQSVECLNDCVRLLYRSKGAKMPCFFSQFIN